MAIQFINEIFDQQRSASIDDTRTRTYERVFQVITDGSDGPIAVREAYGIPQLYTYYAFGTRTLAAEADVLAICRQVRAEQQSDSPIHWRVYCSYDSTFNPDDDDSDNPLNAPAQISTGSVTYEVPIHQDTAGKPLVNKAGDPFDPLPTMDRSRMSVKIQKNLALDSFNPVAAGGFVNTVNSAAFLGLAAGKLKCQAVNANEQTDQGLTYFNTDWEFLYDENGWNPIKVLNAGYRQRIPKPGGGGGAFQLVAIRDGQQGPVNSPWPLDANGKALPDPKTGKQTYCDFTIFKTADFNSIGII